MLPLYPNTRSALPICLALLAASVLLLSGCAIYSPTVPATPVLEKGQVEASVGMRLFAAEATAAWAPTNHLLVVAEGATRAADDYTTTVQGQSYNVNNYHHQASIGLGYYHVPTATSPTYVAVVGGVGFASARLRADDDELMADWLPQPAPAYGEFRARYRRYYGQVFIAWPKPGRKVTGGASLRASVLDYTQLMLLDKPFKPRSNAFVEPTGFVSFGRGPVRFRLSGGLSLPVSNERTTGPSSLRTAPSSVLFGIALLLRPDVLFKQD